MGLMGNNSSNKIESALECGDGEIVVNGNCVVDNTESYDSGFAMEQAEAVDELEDDQANAFSCPDKYFYDDTYEWSDESGARIGACVPDPDYLTCAVGFHYQPSGDLTAGTCVKDYVEPEVAEETEDVTEEDFESDAVTEAIEAAAAAGPTFTPVVSCCTTELGNSIATSLIVSYGTDLETIY